MKDKKLSNWRYNRFLVSLFFISLILFCSVGMVVMLIQGDFAGVLVFIVLDVPLICLYKLIYKLVNKVVLKREAELKAILEIENTLLSEGYEKVYNNFYINQKEKKVAINNKYYDFAQIVDCELCEDTTSTKNTYGKVYDSKIIGQTATTYTTETAYLVNLYINITVDDFVEPNVQLNLRGEGLIKIGSQKYIENRDEANRVLSTLKLIKSKS